MPAQDLTRQQVDFASLGENVSKFNDGSGWVPVTISGTDLGLSPDLSNVSPFSGGSITPKTSVIAPTNEAVISSEILLLGDAASDNAAVLGLFHGSLADFIVSSAFQMVRITPSYSYYFVQEMASTDLFRSFSYFSSLPVSAYQKPTIYSKDITVDFTTGRRSRLVFDRSDELAGYTMPVFDILYLGLDYSQLNGGTFSGGLFAVSALGSPDINSGGIFNNVSYLDTVVLDSHLYETGTKTFSLDGLLNTNDVKIAVFDKDPITSSLAVSVPSFSLSDHPSGIFNQALEVPAYTDFGGAVIVMSPYGAVTLGDYRYKQKISVDLRLGELNSNTHTFYVRALTTESDPELQNYGYEFSISINSTDGSINFNLSGYVSSISLSVQNTLPANTIDPGDWFRLGMEISPEVINGEFSGNGNPIITCTFQNLTKGEPPVTVFNRIEDINAPHYLKVTGSFSYFFFVDVPSNNLLTSTSKKNLIQNMVHTVSPVLITTGV